VCVKKSVSLCVCEKESVFVCVKEVEKRHLKILWNFRMYIFYQEIDTSVFLTKLLNDNWT